MLRTFWASGAQENQNDSPPSPASPPVNHTPHTGRACGRPAADAVTTQ